MKIEAPESQLTVKETNSAPSRWMVVDDDDAILDLIACLLEKVSQAEVCRFHSAAEALAAFVAAPETYQFVVTDLEMPGMNGLELCRHLHSTAPRLKVLLATGHYATTAEQARQSGFCGLLPKPFLAEKLFRAVEEAGVLSSRSFSQVSDQASSFGHSPTTAFVA